MNEQNNENYTQNNFSQEENRPVQQSNSSNGLSIAALVCGILGIVGGFIPVVKYFTLVLAILGIVFGVKGQKQAKEYAVSTGLATAGLVCGIVGAAFSAVGVLCALACVGSASSMASDLNNLL